MDFHQNLFSNFASIIATLLFVSAAGVTIFRGLKLRWPVGVNCWFCNNNTKIRCNQVEWWRCPSCEQYNGFTEDGDYAYDIPEQSRQSGKNFAKSIVGGKPANDVKSLCDKCNQREELKVEELRTFETKWFFDSRLRSFKKELEVKYPLCENCQDLLDNVLRKQSRWLTRYKMLFFKQKSINEIVPRNVKKLDKAIRIFLTMLTSAMMYYPDYWPLPLFGAFFQTSAFVINQAHKRTWDAIMTLLWICISVLGPLNELNFFEHRITKEWPSLQTIADYHFITALAVIIGLTNITSRYRNTRSFRASFKRLEKNSSSSVTRDSFEDLESDCEKLPSDNYTNYRESPTELETPLPMKLSTSFAQDTRQREKQSRTSSDAFISGGREDSSERYSINDSLSTLKKLTLGESQYRNSPRKLPRIFKTKVYGCSTSPDLFQRSLKSPSSGTRKFVLSPPKLKSVTQRSWVAGGYWQLGVVEPPSLSRSSSQSSGFGSAGSNFGRSREPSLTKELDKSSSSVVSEAQFCYCAPRVAAPAYSQQQRVTPRMQLASNLTPVHPEVCGSAVRQSQQAPTNFNSGYPALLTSPVWLPLLLCGSLLLNIAVFCTILLR